MKSTGLFATTIAMNSKSTQSMLAAAILSALAGVCCSNPSSAQAASAPANPAASSAAPTKAEVATAIRSCLAKLDPGERVESISHIRAAKDSTGRWWAWGEVSLGPGTDGSAMIMRRSSDGWKTISYGSSPDAELVPAEIRKELCAQ
jgi:hypothetical protein